jgi:uncharacterized protein (TIGR03067 family)
MEVETTEQIETEPLSPPDLMRLQGHWVSVAGRRPAEFLIEGQQFTFRFHDGDVYIGWLDVVIDEWPRTMLLSIGDGPEKHKGKTTLCIYEIDGDQMRWCPAEPGSDDLPTEFPDVEDARHLCTIFRRVPTARK